MVRMDDFDGDTKLCRTPSFILLECFEGFGFEVKEIKVGKSGHIIYEGDIIFLSTFHFDRSRSP